MDHTLKVAIHQPNFLPWFGFFYKISQSDCFVFLDDVIYSKKSFTRRVQIHHPNNEQENKYSRINLAKHSDQTLISELMVHNQHNWIEDCLVQWKNTYYQAPFYNEIVPQLQQILEKADSLTCLSEINIMLILELMKLLQMERITKKSSELKLTGSSEHINIQICKKLHATHYLSGQGAKKYQQKKDFIRNDIELNYIQIQPIFQHFNIPEHLQNKSIISWLMFYSIEEIHTFLQYKSFQFT